MAEYILKTHVAPPEGWEYTGEFRVPKMSEWYLWQERAVKCEGGGVFPLAILRRARWVPKPGESFWTASEIGGAISWPGECCEVHPLRLSCGNFWRTREQAESYAEACKALAERMHGDAQP